MTRDKQGVIDEAGCAGRSQDGDRGCTHLSPAGALLKDFTS